MEKVWYQSYPEGVPKTIDPDEIESMAAVFEESCERFSDKTAVVNLGVKLSYGDLELKTRQFASYLQNTLKLKKGDRIALMLPNTIQYYIAMFGALRAGVVVVNVNPLYTKRELVDQLKDAEVDTIVVLANFAHTVEQALDEMPFRRVIVTKLGDMCGFPKGMIVNFVVKYIKRIVPSYHLPEAVSFKQVLSEGAASSFSPVEVKSSDIAFLQYTGGTTGIAKGAVLTHRNLVANLLEILAWTDHTFHEAEEIAVLPLPLYHIFSLTCGCFFMIKIGAETHLITNPRDIPHFIKELKGIKFTVFYSINTLCNALLNNSEFENVDFSSLKSTIVGGMAATKDVAEKWHEITGKHLTEGYGLTETSPVITINSFHETEFTGGIGFPIPSTDLKIIDEEGNELPIGEVGELCVKGPQVMKGYWKKPEETKEAFTPDGWFKTGDMVSIDETGLVTLVDRKKDMIIVSGFNVYPNEVESVLMSHPGILEAAVIGVVDRKRGGERVKAIIVKKEINLSKEEIISHCKKELTAYKVPHIIEFREELPKTPVGKILRRALREKVVQ